MEAADYVRAHFAEFVSDLKALVRVPSVSFPGFDPATLARSAEAVAALMRSSGLEHVQILRLPGRQPRRAGDRWGYRAAGLPGAHPYVYGDWLHAPGAPTLLLYAHHDVQPPGREELWRSPPFTPTERAGRLYGRGSADDKAGIVVHTSAVKSWLKAAGKLPVNVKLIVEGEEEVGSHHLEAFLKKYARKLAADVMVLTDTTNFDVGVPSITTTLRGLVSCDVTVRTADHPLHSGMWGGPLPDPVQALAKMIASVTDAHGRLRVPGVLSQVKPLSSVEKNNLAGLRYLEKDFRRQSGLLPRTRLIGGGKNILRRLWREPAFSVNAIQASSRKDCANIVNESAWCHVGLRLAPGMDSEKCLRLLKEHLVRQAPWGARVEFSNETASPPWTTETGHPAFAAAARALGRGFERPAVHIGCGGSIPFVGPFSRVLGGAPALLIGVEDPFTNAHSENESLHLGDFQKSIASAVELYRELAR